MCDCFFFFFLHAFYAFFFNNTWQISIGLNIMIVDPRISKWCFELAVLCGFGSVMCQYVIGQEFFLSTNVPSRLVHTQNFILW